MFKRLEKNIKNEGHKFEKEIVRPVAHAVRDSLVNQPIDNPNQLQPVLPQSFQSESLVVSNSPSEISVGMSTSSFFQPISTSVISCPVSLDFPLDPVTAPDGRTYSQVELQKWYDLGNRTCPLTPNVTLNDPSKLIINLDIKNHNEQERAKQNEKASGSFAM